MVEISTMQLLIIIGSILFGNYVGVKVMQVQLKGFSEKLALHEIQIQELYDRTRYVMSGHQIRESIKEEVAVTHQNIKELQNMCTLIKDQLIAIKTRCDSCKNYEKG